MKHSLLMCLLLCNSDKKKEDSELEQIGGSETDLTAVLNAWYSAGFHTGK